MPVFRRDTGDPIRMSDVRIDFSMNKLELVELIDSFAIVGDGNMARLSERSRIAEPERICTIACNKLILRPRHSPALTRIGELLDRFHGETVIHKTDVRLPSPLIDIW